MMHSRLKYSAKSLFYRVAYSGAWWVLYNRQISPNHLI
jgi:hypothetical protein